VRDGGTMLQKDYRRILALDPKSIPALNRLGALYVRQGEFAEGKNIIGKRFRLDPQNFGTNLNLGIAFLKEQDYPRAVAPLAAGRDRTT
jgi:lipoprotein NlpI